ncbi:Ras-related protein Rab-23 [Hondaea fermentalgiana]|uniref:Ras-related protein Rab-23 n=1 Tax=Hondaea fermentalgiana TaxID=2315210 RepID=A0A2R5G5Y2_9STRA|nr:Ras-related protein Rab-23 [Hondaea fermentalgiana]|eukprot:GBG26400.1 Ras-related protein Rab-23 [Hondaea fermentalgiana]
MDLGDLESSLRVLVLGSSNVGKTSLTSVYVRGEMPSQHKKTIGVDFKEKNIFLEEACEDINLMIWEVGGDHIEGQMAQRYFKDANAAILVFATDDRASFERVTALANKVRRDCGPHTRLVLVQSKIDLENQATHISAAEARELAREVQARLYRVSCKNPDLVEEVFMYVATKCVGAEAAALTDICDVYPEVDGMRPEDSPASDDESHCRDEDAEANAEPSHDPTDSSQANSPPKAKHHHLQGSAQNDQTSASQDACKMLSQHATAPSVSILGLSFKGSSGVRVAGMTIVD